MANIKSQIKRVKTNEKRRQRNKSVRSSVRTAVRKFREAVEAGNTEEAATLQRAAARALDKAASKGVIHKNQAANRKSAMATGVDPVLVSSSLAANLRTIAAVASAGRGSPDALSGVLGMPPWKIRKAQQQVRHWNPTSLTAAFAVAAEVNADVKGAAADVDYALERAVLRICAARGR